MPGAGSPDVWIIGANPRLHPPARAGGRGHADRVLFRPLPLHDLAGVPWFSVISAVAGRRRASREAAALSPAEPRPDRAATASARTVALIVASAMFMEQLDGTVLATALPTMARSLGTDPLHMNVALTSYLLSLAVFIPASGKAADRFGARIVFRAAIGLFTIGSILCAQAPISAFLVGGAHHPGDRRRHDGAGRAAGAAALELEIRARERDGLAADSVDDRPAARAAGRRPDRHLSLLALDLLRQRAGGPARDGAGSRYIDNVREPGRVSFDLPGMVLSGVALASLMWGIEMGSRGVGSRGLALVAGRDRGGRRRALSAYARRHPQPVLDFRLMRIQTFRISVIAGTLSRISVGAMPFLLPMMLQLGFGVCAAESGMITFASSVGSLAMKASAPVLLRRLGFRNTLVWVGLVATLLMGTIAFFRPSWPMAWIYTVLLAGGFLQSLQFMAYNTVAYADVPRRRMSAATSFYTTFQQLSLSLGIAVSAAALAGSAALYGHAQLMLPDFTVAFLVVAAVSMLAPVASTGLRPDAGAELSGHRPGRLTPAKTAASD